MKESLTLQEPASETPVFALRNLQEAQEYQAWREEVPWEVRRLVEGAMKKISVQPKESGFPLTDQFLYTFANAIEQGNVADLTNCDKRISNLLVPLTQITTKGGYINLFETLTNTAFSWDYKRRLYEIQLRPALEWLVSRDLENLAKSSFNQTQSEETDVPSAAEEVRSSMEAGAEKREGEPTALFTVSPFFGGYCKQLVFNRFSPRSGWQKDQNQFEKAVKEETDFLTTRVMKGKIKGDQPLALPLYDNWAFDPGSIIANAPKELVQLLQNQDGIWYLQVDASGVFNYQINLAQLKRLKIGEQMQSVIVGDIPQELTAYISDLKQQRLPPMKLKREIVKFVHKNLIYSNSPEAWRYYTDNPEEYFLRIWNRREADCFVANTFAARAVFELDTYVRFVSGFYIKEQNDKQEAIMHQGNGHGWFETFDFLSRRWVRMDATPKGDPVMDENQQEQELEGKLGEGDYGEQEEELFLEEEVQQQIQQFKQKQSEGRNHDTTTFSQPEQRFAQLAECTPIQAKEFLAALQRVREIKNEHGQSVSDLMKEEWQKIITAREVIVSQYRGPVRMDEGDRLVDPVATKIDFQAGETNPTGFEKEKKMVKTETDFGGLHLYFSFDLSGSMKSPDPASGRTKADVQRDVGLLFIDSLMQSAALYRRQGQNTDLLPLKIMATLASEKGEGILPLTDTWTEKQQWTFYSALTRIAKGSTPTHETLILIKQTFDQEGAILKKQVVPEHKLPLSYVAEISDGEPDDLTSVEALHHELKEKKTLVRSYIIGTESDLDEGIMLESFSQLPLILSHDIIQLFQQLLPKKITH